MKAVSDIFAPATGKIIEVNDEVKKDPAKINQSAEKDAWVAKLDIEKPEEMSIFLSCYTFL